jgi:hypothetical protein
MAFTNSAVSIAGRFKRRREDWRRDGGTSSAPRRRRDLRRRFCLLVTLKAAAISDDPISIDLRMDPARSSIRIQSTTRSDRLAFDLCFIRDHARIICRLD